MEPREGRAAFTLDGRAIWDVPSLCDEAARVLTDGFAGHGHNLAAFCDLLRGGFGRHPYGQPIALTWADFAVSRARMDPDTLLTVLEVICDGEDHDCLLDIRP